MRGYQASLTSGLRDDAGYFQVLDIARRLEAGTGSLGTDRFYVVVRGARNDPDEARILDVKRQGEPSLLGALPAAEREAFRRRFGATGAGCRVAAGHRALLSRVDDHLGCLSALGGSFSVRERSPWKATFDTTTLTSATRLRNLAAQWAMLTAAAHARASRDLGAAPFEARAGAFLAAREASFRGGGGGSRTGPPALRRRSLVAAGPPGSARRPSHARTRTYSLPVS
jgi:uncharacterized protein (DUF2252 family)